MKTNEPQIITRGDKIQDRRGCQLLIHTRLQPGVSLSMRENRFNGFSLRRSRPQRFHEEFHRES